MGHCTAGLMQGAWVGGAGSSGAVTSSELAGVWGPYGESKGGTSGGTEYFSETFRGRRVTVMQPTLGLGCSVQTTIFYQWADSNTRLPNKGTSKIPPTTALLVRSIFTVWLPVTHVGVEDTLLAISTGL